MKLPFPFLWITSSLRKIETHVANPIIRGLLRSRFHWVMSGRLALISYIGHRSGHRYTLPVAYHQLDGSIVAVTPKGKTNWWRNFQHSQVCHVWLGGKEYKATGKIVTDSERESLLAGYIETHGLLGRILGVDSLPEKPSQTVESDHGLAVIRFDITHYE